MNTPASASVVRPPLVRYRTFGLPEVIWNHCLATYPNCPIFKRIHVAQSIIDDQLALENETLDFLEDSGFEPVEDDGEEKPAE